MKNLRLSKAEFAAVIAGKKNNIALKGRHDVQTGCAHIQSIEPPLQLSATTVENADLVVNIFGYKYTKMKNLNVDDLTHQKLNLTPKKFAIKKLKLLTQMQEFYPDMTEETEVTVIYFKYITGGNMQGGGPMK